MAMDRINWDNLHHDFSDGGQQMKVRMQHWKKVYVQSAHCWMQVMTWDKAVYHGMHIV